MEAIKNYILMFHVTEEITLYKAEWKKMIHVADHKKMG